MTVVQHLVDALSAGSLYALLALGIALIFGIVRLVNFAYGELIMVAGYVLVLVAGAPVYVLLPAAIAAATLLSMATERLAFRPARGADPATLLVTSFAVSYLLQNVALLGFGSLTKSADVLPSLTKPMEILGINLSRLDLVVIVVTALLLVAFTQFLRRTDIGTQMRAAAEDFEMARLLGVRANRVIAVAFGLSGALAGVAAIALIAKTGSVTPTVGVNVALFGFIAVILGGMGSGLGLVLAGDLAFCAQDATFCVAPKGGTGAPDPGLAWLLPRAIGQQRALSFGLGGRTLDASTADDWGIAELAPDGDVAAALKDAADNLGGKHLWANSEMRRLLHASWETSRTELSQSEAVTLVRALLTRNKA